MACVDVAPGAKAGRHTRPGDEISDVLKDYWWTVRLRAIKAGESFVVPAGAIHDAQNNGAAPAKLLGVYVVEKGKPLASPAP